jgi:hypothetical protein
MDGRPKMPVPAGELTPVELWNEIRQWAASVGFTASSRPASSEALAVVVRDPAGGFTTTTIPGAHGGRRLRRHQVRYVIRQLDSSWRN